MPETKGWRIIDVVTVVVLSVALGILWWGWTFIAALTKPLEPFGLGYLSSGFWFTGGTLIPFIIRKPGAALIGEILAAGLEGMITQWGATALIWGAVQGLGAECVFLIFRYKRFDALTLALAGALSGVCSWVLDFFYSQYITLAPWIWGVQLVSITVSGIVLAGLLSYYLGKGLIKTGVLRSLLPDEV